MLRGQEDCLSDGAGILDDGSRDAQLGIQRRSMLHGSETWPVRKENAVALQRVATHSSIFSVDPWCQTPWTTANRA